MSDLGYWLDLGRRMKACKGFEWRRGMHFMPSPTTGMSILISDSNLVMLERSDPSMNPPDLCDPGTVGHALAMMREALGDQTMRPECYRMAGELRWGVFGEDSEGAPIAGHYPTEAEAIIKAWETVQ